MGEEVVLPRASPRSLFLRTWEVSSQSLKAVVSFVNNFRCEVPWFDVPPNYVGPFIEPSDLWWLLVINAPSLFVGFAYINLMNGLSGYKISQVLGPILLSGGILTHVVVLSFVMYWYYDRPFRLIGAEAIFLIEVIPMIVASALHHLLEFNYGYLCLLLGFTMYVYGCAHFMHVAYDIGGKDVLLGLVMQIPFYIVKEKLLIRALALSFCVVLCFCKYMMYSAPELPEHGKSTKELEQLPC
ncbi:hypothetical protein CQW23_33294 [Capsicum baccatum]|uniref:Uncharacterized protein n=1 Tax=Capsicum baccatum TaxID=33114 RepID=A0A2G2V267_CAPBA|nr:hypothetical protein CQW23_33294 [Capsicum baccatum]